LNNSFVPLAWRVLLCLVVWQTPSIAGEIPDLPRSLPPYIDRSLEVALSNDFFGSWGSVDDFRTQQITLTVQPAARWTLLLDHSVLTLRDPANPGRTDQMSGSLGYDLISRNEPGRNGRLSVGAGFRSTGEFAGDRMQNGFHRLVQSEIRILPYTASERTDATAWVDAEYYTVMREPGEHSKFGDWRFGSWLRVNSLFTSDDQWDGSAALFAVANRRAVDLWFGLRRDWRTGYEDPVRRETAAAEDDLAVVLGARFGALVLETVQQLNNDASYGQLRLVSTGEHRYSSGGRRPRIGIEAAFLLPDVHLHLAGHTRTSLLTAERSEWRESAFVSIDYGEPQHRDNNSIFIRSLQLGIGLEWERNLVAQGSWLSAYGSLGAGWREETLIGDGAFAGEKSSSVSRAVLLLGAGFRVDAAKLNEKWNFRIQLGVSGWIPEGSTNLPIGAMTLPVQEAALNLALGVTIGME
jgi:hypothetical protein